MRSNERRLYYYDLVIRKLGQSSILPPAIDILGVWQEHHRSGTANHVRQRGRVEFHINDISLDEESGIASILIAVTDTSAPDAAYRDIETKLTTIHKKTVRQGGLLAAHMFVELKPYKADTYLCMIEGVRMMNASNVQHVLNSILRNEYDLNPSRFTYPDPGGAKRSGVAKRIPFLPLIKLGGHPSSELLDDIANGQLSHVALVQSRNAQPFNDDPYLIEEESSLKLSVVQSIPRENRLERLKAAVRPRSSDYSTARVYFKDSTNNLRNIEFDVSTGNIDSSRYIRHDTVRDIEPPMADASELIVDHFAVRARSLLKIARSKV